ncbi:armadillo-type protein, partial [Protomyces lactucae-debilis]
MDFLRGVLSKSSGLPGYTLLDKIDLPAECLHTLHNATRKEDGLACSILTFEATPSVQPLARNYMSKLRGMKHPCVLQYLDGAEVDGVVYIAVERIEPLSYTLAGRAAAEIITWGLYSIAQAAFFVNSSSCIHGNVRVSSIYTNSSGEWKLGGFEVLSSMKDAEPFICRHGGFLKDAYSYTPPELQSRGFEDLKNMPLTALDAYGFGCLIYTAFNGPFRSSSELQQYGKIPNSMLAQYKRLLAANATSRMSVSALIDHGKRAGGFFDTDVIHIAEQVPSLAMQSRDQVEAFLETHMEALSKLPRGFSKTRVLPELAKSFEYGGGGATSFKAVLALAKDFTPDDTEALLVPILLRSWQSNDRAVRLVLLEHLADYVDLLSQKQINDKVFNLLGSSFSDPAPILREAAIRSLMILCPKLSDRNLNGDLLKLLAKTANDAQPGIRTNTTICLGKVARYLNASSARKVLTAAFTRALKDPFVHARLASCQAISATADMYEKEDLALRLLPGIMPLLVDAEGVVRSQAKSTVELLVRRVETLTKDMPETTLQPQQAKQLPQAGSTAGGAIETAGVWAGWAVSKLSRNLDATNSNVPSGTS